MDAAGSDPTGLEKFLHSVSEIQFVDKSGKDVYPPGAKPGCQYASVPCGRLNGYLLPSFFVQLGCEKEDNDGILNKGMGSSRQGLPSGYFTHRKQATGGTALCRMQ